MSQLGEPKTAVRPSGILLVDKPAGPTSHDAVAAVRRALGTRRVGHFGTLDPFATGLLVCGIGPATRLAPFCTSHDKTYAATFRLGQTSTTDDPEGEIVPQPIAPIPDRETIERACEAWTGEVEQTPPAYSAKHVGGERAHALARRGEAVALAPVAVEIRSIAVERYRYPDLDVLIECGPGTYVRALARDLGEALGTGAYCLTLRRLRLGPFTVDRALSLDALSEASARLLPAADAVRDLPRVELGEAAARAVSNGQVARPGGLPAPGWVALFGPRGFIGLGEVVEEGDGGIVRPRRILYPDGEGQ
ncbi:MAG: tRNA pseudouridine(55) synthase TruB [Gemmatimonadota bacterium]